MVRLILIGKRIYDKFSEDEMTVYAAQVSFFVILSFVPFLMLLLTAVQMIPGISKADFLEIAMDIVPADYKSLAFRVVNDLMLKSPATMISATAVTALVCRKGYVQRGKRLKPGQWKRKKALVCV